MKKKFFWGALLGFMLAFWLTGTQMAEAALLNNTTERLEGQNRIQTAIKVSQQGWSKATKVILARSDDFPDSLVAVPLAHHLDAPILLTNPKNIDAQVLTEIQRLGATQLVILGSADVIGSEITDVLQANGITWERIGGANRYETAVQVAEKLGSSNGRVILASGEDFPDALAISPYAGITKTPILLTRKQSMPDVTKAEALSLLSKGWTTQTIVVGGESVIPSTTLQGIPGVTRIAGDNRYDTAAKIYWFAEDVFNKDSAYFSTGLDFPDGLVAGALAAKQKAPIFLANNNGLSPITYSALLDLSSAASIKGYLIGSSAVLSDKVRKMVEGSLQPPYLLAGLTIAVDAGHGGKDPGAIGPSGAPEKNNTLPVALKLADLLRSAGVNVVLTRSTDVSPAGSNYTQTLDLQARVKIANNAKADLFVSIHNDAFTNSAVGGTSTFYSSGNPQSSKSQALAAMVQSELVKQLGLSNRGVKNAQFYVIKNTNMPAILVELGFISNPKEEVLLSSPAFQQKAATGIFQGILKFKGF